MLYNILCCLLLLAVVDNQNEQHGMASESGSSESEGTCDCFNLFFCLYIYNEVQKTCVLIGLTEFVIRV